MFETLAVLYQHAQTISSRLIPAQFGNIVRINAFGRDWKGEFELNVYKVLWKQQDWYIDQNT